MPGSYVARDGDRSDEIENRPTSVFIDVGVFGTTRDHSGGWLVSASPSPDAQTDWPSTSQKADRKATLTMSPEAATIRQPWEDEDNPTPKFGTMCNVCKVRPKRRMDILSLCVECERARSERLDKFSEEINKDHAEYLKRQTEKAQADVNAKHAEKQAEAAALDAEPETSDLKYPQLRFPYEKLQAGRLKDLSDKACEGGLSPGLVVPAILALASSIPMQDNVEGCRINLNVTLLALVGAGKDTAIDRAGMVLGLKTDESGWNSRLATPYTPSGERSIAMLIGDTPQKKGEPRIPGPRTHCIVTYELEETLRKNKGETSGVFTALQHFFDHNEKTYTDTKNRHNQHVHCRLSWLTALPVGESEIDADIFRQAFGDSTSHGFVSRMLFGFAEERFDRRKTRNWSVPASEYSFGTVTEEQMDFGPVVSDTRRTLEQEIRVFKCKGFSPEVAIAYESWYPRRDWTGRDPFHAAKVAILTAIINGHEFVSMGDWRFAVAFMEWEGRIREVFQTGKAKKTTPAEFNEIILSEVKKRTAKALKEPDADAKNVKVTKNAEGKVMVFIRWRKMANDGKWYRHGLDTEKTIKGLVRGGYLAYQVEAKHDDQGRFLKDNVDEIWVRIVGWKPGQD